MVTFPYPKSLKEVPTDNKQFVTWQTRYWVSSTLHGLLGEGRNENSHLIICYPPNWRKQVYLILSQSGWQIWRLGLSGFHLWPGLSPLARLPTLVPPSPITIEILYMASKGEDWQFYYSAVRLWETSLSKVCLFGLLSWGRRGLHPRQVRQLVNMTRGLALYSLVCTDELGDGTKIWLLISRPRIWQLMVCL